MMCMTMVMWRSDVDMLKCSQACRLAATGGSMAAEAASARRTE